MKEFQYRLITQTGILKTGKIQAGSLAEAKKLTENMRQPGGYTLELKETFSWTALFNQPKKIKVKKSDILQFTRQLASLHSSGLLITDALIVIRIMTKNTHLRQVIQQLIDSIDNGASFSKSCEQFPELYEPEYVAMLKAGEASGTLDTILMNLFEMMEQEKKLTQKVKKVFRYPLFVIGTATVGQIGVFTFIIPKMESLLKSRNSELPQLTKVLLSISNFLTQNGLILLLVLCAIAGLILVSYRRGYSRLFIDTHLFKIPLFGTLYKNLIVARVTKVLGILYEHGIPLQEELAIAKKLYSNSFYKQEINRIQENLERGVSLGLSTNTSPLFTGLANQMILTGEKSGKLGFLLSRNSELYTELVDYTVDNILTYLEPIIILIIGVQILALALGIFIPMMNLTSMMSHS